jgi:hypothetical protein
MGVCRAEQRDWQRRGGRIRCELAAVVASTQGDRPSPCVDVKRGRTNRDVSDQRVLRARAGKPQALQVLRSGKRDFGRGLPVGARVVVEVVDDGAVTELCLQCHGGVGWREAADQSLVAEPVDDHQRDDHAVVVLGDQAAAEPLSVVRQAVEDVQRKTVGVPASEGLTAEGAKRGREVAQLDIRPEPLAQEPLGPRLVDREVAKLAGGGVAEHEDALGGELVPMFLDSLLAHLELSPGHPAPFRRILRCWLRNARRVVDGAKLRSVPVGHSTTLSQGGSIWMGV